jgi:two-component system nitrogen regulation response regulator NtrX
MSTILIIDDESGIRQTLKDILEDEQYWVFTAADALTGLEIMEQEPIRLVLLDVLLPKMGGLEALEKLRALWPDVEVVMISGHANVDMAVRAVKLGAFDFLEKPLSLDRVLTVCRNVFTVTKLRKENHDLKKNAGTFASEIIGDSKSIKQLRDVIQQAAASDARILITGENGTGKELAAQAIHRGSARDGKPFIEVNCAALPDTLIESELFGYEKGAFTDAFQARRGRFEAANGGTLFLDEIGDMSLAAQAKVLRAVQEQKIERLGSEKTIDIDVRIVAATNKNLETECAEGRFRQDLFFRLNVIPIRVPSLRERTDDIPLLLYHFLKEFDSEKTRFDDAAIHVLRLYGWPGNIRELRNCAERIAVMHRTDIVRKEDLAGFLQTEAAKPEQTPTPVTNELFTLRYSDAKDAFEKQYLEFQLAKNDGNINRTAVALGLYQNNLYAKLRKYGIKTGK